MQAKGAGAVVDCLMDARLGMWGVVVVRGKGCGGLLVSRRVGRGMGWMVRVSYQSD